MSRLGPLVGYCLENIIDLSNICWGPIITNHKDQRTSVHSLFMKEGGLKLFQFMVTRPDFAICTIPPLSTTLQISLARRITDNIRSILFFMLQVSNPIFRVTLFGLTTLYLDSPWSSTFYLLN